jgi:hypothetical protein
LLDPTIEDSYRKQLYIGGPPTRVAAKPTASRNFGSVRAPPLCSFGPDGSIQTASIGTSTFQQTQAKAQQVGLKSSTGQAMDVSGFQVEAQVVDLASRVRISQTFENTTNSPIEALYSFPVNAVSAIVAFSANVDGSEISGCVKPKHSAFNRYDDSIAEGKTAALLEKGK